MRACRPLRRGSGAGASGMLHDFDYEMHPTAPRHPMKGAEILASRGVPSDIVHAVLAHADYSGMPRVSRLDRALYDCDELTGFVHACALVRPGKVISGLEPASVRKKLKDKGFARTVNRDDVTAAPRAGGRVDAHIAFVVDDLNTVVAGDRPARLCPHARLSLEAATSAPPKTGGCGDTATRKPRSRPQLRPNGRAARVRGLVLRNSTTPSPSMTS